MGMNTETSLIINLFLNGCQLIVSYGWNTLHDLCSDFPQIYSLLVGKDQSQSADLSWQNPQKID